MPPFNVPLLVGDVVLGGKDEKIGLAGMGSTQEVPPRAHILDRFEDLVKIVKPTSLAEMIESIELFEIDHGLGITHTKGAFHHAAGHRDPLCAGQKRGEEPPHGVVGCLHVGRL